MSASASSEPALDLIVSAPRGSGGAYRQLAHVLCRVPTLRPGWRVRLYTTEVDRWRALPEQIEVIGVAGSGHRARLLWEYRLLPRLLAAEPRVLVYSPFGPLLNRRLAPRAVWMSRNIIPLLAPSTWEVSLTDGLRLRIVRRALQKAARAGAGVICVSHHARAKLAAVSGVSADRIMVVPHGSEDEADGRGAFPSTLASMAEGRFVLHVGQPVPYRRTLELIRAYGALAQRRPDVPPMLFVGSARSEDRAYSELCQRELAALVARGVAVSAGELPHPVVVALTRRADLVVYPSIHEDCPNVVLEALAASRPLVCADIPATRELCGDAAVFVGNPSLVNLPAAIDRALFDEPLRERLREAGARRARLYSWDRAARATVEALENAARRAGGLRT